MRLLRTLGFAVALSLLLGLGLAAAYLDAPPSHAQAPTPLPAHYEFIRQWGNRPAHQPPLGVFDQIGGLAFDTVGQLYVVDQVNHRVQVLNREGQAVRQMGWLGEADGELYRPARLAVDGQGIVYITDEGDGRVIRFAADGSALPSWYGFDRPYGIGIGGDGSIYVAEAAGVQKLSPDGQKRSFVVETDQPVKGLKVKREGEADVLYTFGQDRVVRKFSADGVLLAAWTEFMRYYLNDLEADERGNVYATGFSSDPQRGVEYWLLKRWAVDGSVERYGGLWEPRGIALGPDGLIYVSDGNIQAQREATYINMSRQRITRLTTLGAQVEPSWGSEEGRFHGQMVQPFTLAWAPSGHVWVYDANDGRFQQFTPMGDFVSQFTYQLSYPVRGTGHFQFDRQGNILVSQGCRLFRLSPTGTVLATYEGSPGCALLPVNDPALHFRGVAGFDLDPAGNIWVADYQLQRVAKLNSQGQRVQTLRDPAHFLQAHDVAVDTPRDHLYVLTEADQIVVYTLAEPNQYLATWQIYSLADPRRLSHLAHIEVDADGYVFVGDESSATV